MKKNTFSIHTDDGLREVSGLTSKLLGYYRSSPKSFSVTHLPTGCQVHVTRQAREAKAFIAAVEAHRLPPSAYSSELSVAASKDFRKIVRKIVETSVAAM